MKGFGKNWEEMASKGQIIMIIRLLLKQNEQDKIVKYQAISSEVFTLHFVLKSQS